MDMDENARLLGMIAGLRNAITALAHIMTDAQRQVFVQAMERGAQEAERRGLDDFHAAALTETMIALAKASRQ